jgi:tetratricopeptide (TPR) repeat protein
MQIDLLFAEDKYDAALEISQKLLELSQETGNRRMKAIALGGLAVIHNEWEQVPEAIQYARNALDLQREIGDRIGERRSFNILGHILARSRKFEESKELHLRALRIAEEMGDSYGILSAVAHLYKEHYGPMRISEASLEFIHNQLGKSISRGDDRATGSHRWLLGQTLEAFGQYERAIDTLQESVQAMDELGADEVAAFQLVFIGRYQTGMGKYNEARESFNKAENTYERLGKFAIMFLAINRAYLDLHEGNVSRYREHIPQILEVIDNSRVPYRWALSEGLDLAARLHLALDEPEAALEYISELIRLLETRFQNYTPQQYLFTHSNVLRALGEEEKSDAFLRQASEWVMRVANNVQDGELKKSYLENVKVNRQILAEASARGIERSTGSDE